MTAGIAANTWLALVDDDPAIHQAINWLCDEVGLDLNGFDGGEGFLDALPERCPVCVILDYQMPQVNGLDLLANVRATVPHAAILMLTGFGTVPLAVQSLGQGAYSFVEKPFNDAELIRTIQSGVRLAEDRFALHIATSHADTRLALLTDREREVFDLVACGHASKVIADQLGVATKTVEVHRSRAMMKLGVTTMADVLELAKQASPLPPKT